MKRFLLALSLCLSSFAWGQVYSSGGPVTNTLGQPTPAQVAVCTTKPAGTGAPDCSSYVQTYTDITLATPCTLSPTTLGPLNGTGCTNPGNTDSRGNYSIFATSGTVFFLEFYGYGIVPYVMPASTGATSTANFSSPPPIGNVTPNTGQFTTLSAKSVNQVIDAAKYCTTPGVLDQTCWNNAITAASTGDEIYVPAGVYTITAPISISKAVYIHGAGGSRNQGYSGTYVTAANGYNQDYITSNVAGSLLNGLRLEGVFVNGARNTSAGACLHLGNWQAVTVRDSGFYNCYQGLWIEQVNWGDIDNVFVSDNTSDGILISPQGSESIGDVWIRSGVVTDNNSGNGISIVTGASTQVVGGIYLDRIESYGNKQNGLYLSGVSGSSFVNIWLNSTILDSNCQNGLLAAGAQQIEQLKIIDGWFSSNGVNGYNGCSSSGSGVAVYSSSGAPRSATFVGGMVLFNGNHGIDWNGTNGLIEGVEIFGNNKNNAGAYGINVRSSSSNLSIIGNRLFMYGGGAQMNGLAIASGATDTEVQGNFLDVGGGTRYTDAGTRTRAYNNIIDHTLSYAATPGPTQVGGETQSYVARATISAFGATVGTSPIGWSNFIPDHPITVTRVTALATTAPSGCSTSPKFGETGGGATCTMANGSTSCDSGAISVNYSGSFNVGVANSDSGCSPQPSNVNVTLEYKLQ